MIDKKKLEESAKDDAHLLKEIIKTIVLVALIFVTFRFYLVQPFLVSGSSMEPTFQDGEYILVNEFSYLIGDAKRGDVVVFKHPAKGCVEFVNSNYINRKFLQGPCTNFIKRIVALPNETIEIKEGEVTIFNEENPNGKILNEDYIDNIRLFGNQKVTLGKDEYFVLGDNRQPSGSTDSREWGPLPEKFITGKAALIAWPFPEFKIVKTPKY